MLVTDNLEDIVSALLLIKDSLNKHTEVTTERNTTHEVW